MEKIKNIKGFSLLEVMLVVFLFATALGFSVLYSQTSQLRADINTQSKVIVSYLRLAQSNALSGSNSENGIHFESDSYTIFSGNVFDPDDTANYEITLPNTITIENLNLNGGGSDVIFDGPKGETVTYGSFDLVSEQINQTITINISSIGTINY